MSRIPRYAARRDDNEAEIVETLRALGCSVTHIDIVDLIVGKDGFNFLFEVKDPNKKPSARKLTDREQKFFDSWRGQVHKIETAEEALSIMHTFFKALRSS